MNGVLLTAGVVAILAAVVGGGLQAFDMTVPVVDSRARQALLFGVGVAFIGTAYLLREDSGDGGTGEYRATAKAACERMLAVRDRPIPQDAYASLRDNTFKKDVLLADLRDRHRTFDAELRTLLAREAPGSLAGKRDTAKSVTDQWLATFDSRLDALESLPKDVIGQADASVLNQADDAQVRVRVNDSLSDLTGTSCAIAGA